MTNVIHAPWCAYLAGKGNCNCGSHEILLARKRRARMDIVDNLSPDVRALVHEYGWTTVKALLDLGVTKANHIRHVVETVLNEFSPTRSTFSSQGVSTVNVRQMTERQQMDLAD